MSSEVPHDKGAPLSELIASDSTVSELPVAELAAPACSLQTLTSRSQADFEIDFFERILNRNPENVDVLRALGDLFSEKGWARRALQIDLRLAALQPRDPAVSYNLACSHALLGHVAEALLALRRALSAGFRDFQTLATDPDLESLRIRPEFAQVLQLARQSCGPDADTL